MKVLFVWTGVTSYMADCWRALSLAPDVELKVLIAERPGGYGTAFDAAAVMRNLDWSFCRDLAAWKDLDGWRPDVVFSVGWREPLCRQAARWRPWAAVPKICCFDMPWEWKPKKIAARFVLWSFLRRFRAAYVPGRVSARYAKWLGFRSVFTGLFGIDVRAIRSVPTPAVRRGFVYVGRLSPEKRIDVLAKAYRLYRERGGRWGLDVYGIGSEAFRLEDIPGVALKGFAQPGQVRAAYRSAGALVLTSSWDPWPLVIAESCAAELPVVCTDHCWNACELIRGNGTVVPVGDARALAEEMLSLERTGSDRARGSDSLVEPYSCEAWSERVCKICREVVC